MTIKGDKKREADESFYVLLSGPSVNAVIWNAAGVGHHPQRRRAQHLAAKPAGPPRGVS